MNKFIIFTDARTGSISMSKMLGSLYKNKLPHSVITEPFCKDSLKNYYPELYEPLRENLKYIDEEGNKAWKTSLKDIEKVLDKCFESANGIKHIWSHLDLEGKLQNEFILNYAIRKKIKIILLSRNNFVLRAISLMLARQSDVWSVETENDKSSVENFSYKDINIEKLEDNVNEYTKYLYRYEQVLAPFDYYDISYEDFFKTLETGPKEKIYEMQLTELHKLCKFLGGHPKNLDEEIVNFNLSKSRKQNKKDILTKIPNIMTVARHAKSKWNKSIGVPIKQLRAREDEDNFGQILNKEKKDLHNKFCVNPFDTFEVLKSGDVHLCCTTWLGKSIGNLNDSSVEEIFNSEKAKEIRRTINDGTFEYCKHKICPKIQGDYLPSKEWVQKENPRYSEVENLSPKFYSLSYDESCNLSCPSCRVDKISWTEGPQYEKRKKLQDKILDYVLSEDNKEPCVLNVTGSGDPFGSKLFRELLFSMDGEKHPNVQIDIKSNGVMFSPAYWKKMKKIHNNFRNVYISLDATTKETYDIVRRGGNWEAATNNVKFLSSLVKKNFLKHLRLDFVVQHTNYKEIADFVRLGKELGACQVCFQLVTDWGTWGKEEYNNHCIWKKDHPEFENFIEVLKDPVLIDQPYVFLGNMKEYVDYANK